MVSQGNNLESKSINDLSIADIKICHVWQYANKDSNELQVKRVRRTPVKSLLGKVVGAQVIFANGLVYWALIGNVDISNKQLTEHFLTISLYINHQWFSLARYHDFNFNENGPAALSMLLGLDLDSIFPIYYDIREYVIDQPAFLKGYIQKEPVNKLSRSEIIALAVP